MICSNCTGSDLNIIKSVTNSTYYYCKNCSFGLEKASKQSSLDDILSALFKTLNSSKFNSLKIQVKEFENNLLLLVNNVHIKSVCFDCKLSKMDIYFLENTIYDLINDYCKLDSYKIDVLVLV